MESLEAHDWNFVATPVQVMACRPTTFMKEALYFINPNCPALSDGSVPPLCWAGCESGNYKYHFIKRLKTVRIFHAVFLWA